MLEDFGNMVAINGRKIPAVNIQVENVPGFLEHSDGTTEWYGVYFEIMFEAGYLWVIEQDSDIDNLSGKIIVAVYKDYAFRNRWESPNPDLTIPVSNWGEFLEMYDAKDSSRAA